MNDTRADVKRIDPRGAGRMAARIRLPGVATIGAVALAMSFAVVPGAGAPGPAVPAPAAPPPAAPGDAAPPPTPAAPPPAVPSSAETFAGLAFMAGCWEGEQEGVRSEECWLAPANGLMVGMHRDLFKSGKAFFEFLRIEAGPEGIAYLASPAGAPATAFRLAAAAPGRVEFANPQHDYPQRIIYQADGIDRIKARVEGPGAGGTTRFEEWTWTRRR
jgi:hypothetical protein